MFTIRTLNTGQDPKFSRFFQKKSDEKCQIKKEWQFGNIYPKGTIFGL